MTELDPRHDDPRVGIAGDRDSGDVRAMHPVARKIDFLDRALVLVGLERRQEALQLACLGTVDVRTKIGKSLEARFELRHAAPQIGGDRLQLSGGGVRVLVERNHCALAVRGLHDPVREKRRVDAAVPDCDVDRLAPLAGRKRDIARRPDVGLVDLVRGKVGAVGADERFLERQYRDDPVFRVDERRRELGAQRARLVDRRLHGLADVAQRQRLADDFRARLAFLDFVLHDLVGHRAKLRGNRMIDLVLVRVRRAVPDLALGADHRADRETRQKLVGGLLFQLAHMRRAFQRLVVTAFEIIETNDDAEQLAERRLVGDFILCEHRFGVAAKFARERLELRVVADDFVQLAIDLVGEPRQVRGFLDALLVLRRSAAGNGERQQARE